MAKKKIALKVHKKRDLLNEWEASPYFTPALFGVLALAVIILFREFIFSDKMLHGSDMIQAGIFFRSLLVDFVSTHGAIPQWNPFIFGGMPYVEAFHGDIFYPLSILKFFGTLHRMLGMVQVLHIFLAGLFMYLCARQFKLSKTASLVSATCYMFAAYLVSFIAPGHDGKIFVTTLFPLTMLFVDRGFQTKPFLNFSLLGLTIGFIILSPHPQMSYFMLWAVGLYTFYKLVFLFKEKKSVTPLIRPSLLAIYAVIIGLALSAIQFYPGYTYTSTFSPRADSDSKSGWDWATSWSMHEEETMSLIIPEFVGASVQNRKSFYWGKNWFKDNSEAVGAVTFFLALLGLFFSRRRDSYFFGGLAIFALLYALGSTTPVFKVFYYLIPKVKSLRAPSMIMFLFSFSASMLAGMGIQKLRDVKGKDLSSKFNWLLFGFPGLLFVLALGFSSGRGLLNAWIALFYSSASTTQVQQGITKVDVAYANLPAIQSGAWFAFLFVALTAGCIWLYRSGKVGATVFLFVAFIPVIDGIRFDSRFIEVFDQATIWAPNPMTDFFTRQNGEFRVMNFGGVQEDLLPYHKIEMVTGYHGNQLRWYDDLLGGPGVKNKGNARFLNLAGAQFITLPGNQKLPEQFLGSIPVREVANFGAVRIYENDNVLPRVYLVDRYKVFNDRKEIYPLVLNGSDSLRRIVYLEEEPEIEILPDTGSGVSSDSAWIVVHDLDSVLVGLNVTRNQLLVLNDNWFDAWHVTLDGKPAKVLRAYGTFRAVAVPAGTKTALFTYHSKRYETGRLITWLTSLYLMVIFAVSLIRRKKRLTPEGTAD